MEDVTDKPRVALKLYRSEFLQLGVVVLVAAASAGFLAWNARYTGKVESGRQELLRHVVSDANELQFAVADFAANGRDSARDVVFSARADLTARLDSLALGWPAQRAPIERVSSAANSVVEQAERVWVAEDAKARRESMQEFDRLAGRMHSALVDLDMILSEDLTNRLDDFALHAFGVLTALAILHVATGCIALMRQIRRERHWRDSVNRLDHSLETIFDPKVGIGDIDALLGKRIVKTVAALEKAHTDLMIAERSERHHARFAQDLIEALEIDDTPEHVYDTVERAAQLRMGGSSFRLLVADNSGSSLEEKVKVGEPICEAPLPHRCPAIRKGRLVAFTDRTGLARCPFLKGDGTKAMCAPVASGGRAFAVSQLTWEGDATKEQLEGDLVTLVGTLGTRLGVLRTLEEREQQASTDPLTGLANRRAMKKFLEDLDRGNRRYCVIACDLDHFKNLNDVHGHETGDKCLVTFARVLKEQSREGDLACRPGGEEFLLILANVDAESGGAVADRIREALVKASEMGGVPFTCSMGVAGRPDHAASFEDLLLVADRLLYEAKKAGRDRACIAGGEKASRAKLAIAEESTHVGIELPSALPVPGAGGEPPKDEDEGTV